MKKIKGRETVLNRFCGQFRNKYIPYSQSLRKKGKLFYFLVRRNDFKKFLVIGEKNFKILPLNQRSCNLLQNKFPYLSPVTSKGKASFGFGDRLGITTPAHVRVAKKFGIFPIFAQQSVRELKKTGRTFKDVLADAVFGVFQEGYKGQYGADADHIKTISELRKAIQAGFTFFTVDLSDEIGNYHYNTSIRKMFSSNEINKIIKRYLNKTYYFAGRKIKFDLFTLQNVMNTYIKAIIKVESFFNILKKEKKEFELEISVDETSIPTSYFDHIFLAEEFKRRKIKFQSLALRFPGKFEKAVDYKGNIKEFASNLKIHSAIAKKFGYKLSLHSGSDKFSIYPVFYKETRGNFHIKTSGTSWLEAIKVIALKNPSLYRKLHNLALKEFSYNKKFYDISSDLGQIPKLDKIPDKKLYNLLFNSNVRQMMHISYGSLLSAFRKEIYKTLFKFEEEFYEFVIKHLQKHLNKQICSI